MLSNLVQAFEVQGEKTSPVRYMATMTLQFKPLSTRAYLNKSGLSFSDIRSRPLVILPLVVTNSRAVLWEDTTPWRAAWEEGQKQTGLVSIVVPGGDLDDIAVIGAADALAVKQDSLQALIKKYQAGGALIATLNTPQDPTQAARIDVTRTDASGKPSDPIHFTLPPIPDPKAEPSILTDGVRQVRSEIEKTWRQASKSLKGPAAHLPLTAPIESLAAWNTLKAKLGTVTGVTKINVLSVSRDGAKIDLEYHGDLPTLQTNLAEQGLTLQQTEAGWILMVKPA